jgi:hypothetical protein
MRPFARLHQHLGRRTRADRDRLPAGDAQLDAVGLRIALFDHDLIARHQLPLFDEPQEARILVGHARDDEWNTLRRREQIINTLSVRPSGDDASLQIDCVASEHFVDPVDQRSEIHTQPLGFVVHSAQLSPSTLTRKSRSAMAADHDARFSPARQSHAERRPRVDGGSASVDHRRRRAGTSPGRRDPSHRNDLSAPVAKAAKMVFR